MRARRSLQITVCCLLPACILLQKHAVVSDRIVVTYSRLAAPQQLQLLRNSACLRANVRYGSAASLVRWCTAAPNKPTCNKTS